jgi:hypothetical protein
MMLDRMECQPRLDNSPFLRCVHNNESLTSFPLLLLHSLCLPGCHRSTSDYPQRIRSHPHMLHRRQTSCRAIRRGTKSASPRPTSGLSMADTCRHEIQDYPSPHLPTGPYSLRSRFHTLDPGHSTLPQTPPLQTHRRGYDRESW